MAFSYLFISYLDLDYASFKTIDKMQNQYILKNWDTGNLQSYQKVPRSNGWRKLTEINEQAYMAIVISEDWRFFQHSGLDLEQVSIAIKDFILGKKMRGASTISQQLIKNLFTEGERSLARKAKEFLLTKYLENKVSKEKILETYLNNIQYGKDLYGFENASQFYFDKTSAELNVKEGAFLAMLLPSPVRYSISYKEKRLTEYADSKISSLLHKLKVAKVIDSDELLWYQELPLNF